MLDGSGEAVDDVVVPAELREVFEGQVKRPGYGARAAQVAQLGALTAARVGHERRNGG